MVLSNKSWVLLGFHQRYIEMYWDVTNNVQDNERFNQPKYGTHRPKWAYNEDIATKELPGYGYTSKNSCVSRKGPGDEKTLFGIDASFLAIHTHTHEAHCNDCNKSNLRLETWAIFVWILISGVVSQRGHCEPNQLDGWIYIYIGLFVVQVTSEDVNTNRGTIWHHLFRWVRQPMPRTYWQFQDLPFGNLRAGENHILKKLALALFHHPIRENLAWD